MICKPAKKGKVIRMDTNMLNVRKTSENDLPRLLEIYEYARKMMKENGNPNQWITYPPEDLVRKDICDGISYVIESDGRICGTFVFYIGDDPAYKEINGKWLNCEDYGVIHRIASDGSRSGILETAVKYCSKYIPNLKMDTHSDNKIMQHLLEKNGFVKCGTVNVGSDSDDGMPRIAYQRINLSEE